MVDEEEEERLADVAERRKRGKGAPKKAKTKGEVAFFCFWFCTDSVSCIVADSRRLHKKR